MKKLTWKRIVIALSVLCVCCVLCIATDNVYFFFLGLAAFFVIIAAAFIG